MSKKFTNNEIKLRDIPKFEDIETNKLEKSYMNIVIINEIIGFIVSLVPREVFLLFSKLAIFSKKNGTKL